MKKISQNDFINVMTPNERKLFLQNELLSVDNTEYKNGNAKGSSWIFYLSAFAANILPMSIGSVLVWPSPVLPKLMSNDTEVNPLGRPITTLETSLIVSLPTISVIIGTILASKPPDLIGRKRSLLCYEIIIFFCLICIAFSNHIYIYYVSFFLIGIFNMCMFITVNVYNTEIPDDKNRAWLTCCPALGWPLGQLVVFVYGAMIDSVRIITLLITVPILIYFLLYRFTVESPMFLIQKNKKAQALKTLRKLRNYDDVKDVEREYRSIEGSFMNRADKKINFLELFRSYKMRKAIFLSFSILFTVNISGMAVILAYMGLIFKEAGAVLSANQTGVVVGCVNVTSVFLCIFIVNRCGKRPLLLISSLFCSLSLASVGVYFYIKEIESPFVDYIRWLPVVSLILFVIFYSLGLGSIPVGYMPELFPNELRTTGQSAGIILGFPVTFVLDFVFPLLSKNFGTSCGMFLCSISTFVGFVVMYFCVPETRGKNLKEIQDMLEKKIFSFDL